MKKILFAICLIINAGLYAQTTHTINTGSYYYTPSSLTIDVGDSVIWINDGGFHDVNGDINSISNQPFNNPVTFDSPSTSTIGAVIFAYKFTVAGTYNYDCSVGFHAASGMVGVIIVQNTISPYTSIPDQNFEQKLINLGYDNVIDGQVLTANISGVTSLNINYSAITDLTGIVDFTALAGLNCENNFLTSLDVSQNTALTYLNCNNNQLTSLDVSQNTSLTTLYCQYNSLLILDMSQNTSLTTLYCFFNQLTSLNVTQNTALTYLTCYNNQLTSLDVSQNTFLYNLGCSDNQLTSLDVSQNTALISLGCGDNQLTNLNVNGANFLSGLFCKNNQLTSLDVSTNIYLTDLNCNDNQLTNLNVNGANTLTTLRCQSNQLTSLDVTQNTALNDLYCNDNQLTSLDVTQNTALTYLNCNNNQLTSLDVSQNTALTYLECYNNQLTSLDVRNGNNTNFTSFWVSNNSNLNCISVDDATWSTANWINIDSHTDFGNNCASFSLSDSTVCIGDAVTFTDLSTGIPTSWFWDFGDGNTSTLQNPTHSYATCGIYDVSLFVNNDSLTVTNFITVNTCGTQAASTPFFENFDNASFCSFGIQITSDDFDWTLNSGTTASSGTGPTDDITGGGGYIYIETSSPRAQGDSAILNTVSIDISSLINPQLRFFSHMYGVAIGELSVWVTDNTGIATQVFIKNGDQSNQWNEELVSLSNYTGIVQFTILGITGSDYTGDIAIDNFEVRESSGVNNCNTVYVIDTLNTNVADIQYQNISPHTYLAMLDTFPQFSNPNCDSIVSTYRQFIYNPNYFTDTILTFDTLTTYDTLITQVFDSLTVYDTLNISVIDTSYISISVTDTLYIDITVTGMTSMDNTITVYPNPANDVVIIDNGNYSIMNNYNLMIFNSLSQQVFFSQINTQQFQIPVSSLGAEGTYIIRIFDSSNNIVKTKYLILN